MKSFMSMSIDTTWGNAITLSVESELDNAHDLTTAQIAKLQVYTLSMMVAEVRRENEHDLNVQAHLDTAASSVRERERFQEMEQSRREDEPMPSLVPRRGESERAERE